MKTATEVISQDSKTARTIKSNKNVITEVLEQLVHSLIAIGTALKLIPVKEYAVTIGWQDNIVIDDNPNAAIEIKNGSTVVENGGSATWSSGENVVTVKVTNGSAEKTYTVTVTKS